MDKTFTIPIPDIKITGWGNEETGYNYADCKDVRRLKDFVIDIAKSHNELLQEVLILREKLNYSKKLKNRH